jgi:hypothetical protein
MTCSATLARGGATGTNEVKIHLLKLEKKVIPIFSNSGLLL